MKRLLLLFTAGVAICAFTAKNSPSETISAKKESENKARVLAFYEQVVNAHNVDAIDSFVSNDYKEHQYDTHFMETKRGMKKAFAHYFKAFPDVKVKVNFMTVEGDIVTSQITTTATNTGPIYGRPATNRKIEIHGVDIVRLRDGKAVEHWGYQEEGKLLTQLGLAKELVSKEEAER